MKNLAFLIEIYQPSFEPRRKGCNSIKRKDSYTSNTFNFKRRIERVLVSQHTEPEPVKRCLVLYAGDNKDSIAYKSFDSVQNENVTTFLELLEDPAIQDFLGIIIDKKMATSSLKILQRLARIEQLLGIEDYGLEEGPAIPERLDLIEAQLNSPIIPQEPRSKTESRASFLVQELKAQEKGFMTSHDITEFLRSKLPEFCALPNGIQNVRKVKADVIEKARLMFPGVFVNKKKFGRKEVRLVCNQ